MAKSRRKSVKAITPHAHKWDVYVEAEQGYCYCDAGSAGDHSCVSHSVQAICTICKATMDADEIARKLNFLEALRNIYDKGDKPNG